MLPHAKKKEKEECMSVYVCEDYGGTCCRPSSKIPKESGSSVFSG